MIPPKEKPSWDFEEFLKWLAHHPEALEPGLRMLDEPVQLGPDLAPDACGLDGLGRPCLVVHIAKFTPGTYDRLLGLIARMRAEADQFRGIIPQPTAPRLMLLAPAYPDEAKERLALLAQAFPLRCFRVQPPADGRRSPSVMVEDLMAEPTLDQHLATLPSQHPTRFARRLLSACRVLYPVVLIRGEQWPLVLQGAIGPLATVLAASDGLHFAVSGQVAGQALLPLESDDATDLAIDFLMQAQEKSGSSAA
ncbi:MAG: hypothetical protein ACPG31_12840 [Planctomycetota bacterium]